MSSRLSLLLASTGLLIVPLLSPAIAAADLPHLQRRGAATQLIVEGQPYLALAGELHNSSSTSRAYMEPIWPKLTAMHVNTVLAAVPWQNIEPVEGQYDFSIVDHLVEDARRHGVKLSLLWFGSWKNGLSHYTPDWVKADRKRFPYALTRYGTVEILSVFSEAAREADAKAFAATLRHLREIDADRQTVVMVQVENEVGLHADARDRSSAASAAYAKPVPSELLEYLREHREELTSSLHAAWRSSGFKTSGTWAEVFGATPAGEEIFQAWYYARYLDRVAGAGKAEYPLPMFVNAWIVQPQDELPGDYPAGGPQAHSLDVWRAAARHIDIFAPDIYLPNFAEVSAQFARPDAPFFVPESRAGIDGVANAFIAIGRHHAIGYSPFGIESVEADPGNGPISRAYAVLGELSPLILEQQAKGSIAAVSLDAKNTMQLIPFGDYVVQVSLLADRRSGKSPESGYAMVMQTAPDAFVVCGGNVQVGFATTQVGTDVVGLATVEEGRFEKGKWIPGRTLNGDEVMLDYDFTVLAAKRMSGTGLRFAGPDPTIQRATVYRFPQSTP